MRQATLKKIIRDAFPGDLSLSGCIVPGYKIVDGDPTFEWIIRLPFAGVPGPFDGALAREESAACWDKVSETLAARGYSLMIDGNNMAIHSTDPHFLFTDDGFQ